MSVAISWANKMEWPSVTFWLVFQNPMTFVTVSVKTVLNGTFSITTKTDLKYSGCCGSVVLDFSHVRLTV